MRKVRAGATARAAVARGASPTVRKASPIGRSASAIGEGLRAAGVEVGAGGARVRAVVRTARANGEEVRASAANVFAVGDAVRSVEERVRAVVRTARAVGDDASATGEQPVWAGRRFSPRGGFGMSVLASFVPTTLRVMQGMKPFQKTRASSSPWEHRTFGPRSAIERWFGLLKRRTKRFYHVFPHRSSERSVLSWMEAWVRFYNWEALSRQSRNLSPQRLLRTLPSVRATWCATAKDWAGLDASSRSR